MSCYTYNLLRYVYAAQPENIFNNDEEKISLDDADDLLRQLNIEARAHHFKLIFIFLPSNTRQYESEINDLRNLMAKNNSPYLNLRESLKTCSGSQSAEKYFLKSDVCHFSVEGNRVFAEILYHDRAKLGL